MAKKVKKEQGADVKVTYYDVAAHTTRTESASAIANKYSTKETVNLCIRERKGISYEMFFLLLAIFFSLLLIFEYFCVYRPYYEVEQLEKQLAARQAEVERIYGSMSDRQEKLEEYRKYNYENFPREIVSRDDILELLERTVFKKGKVSNVSISRNTLTMTVSEVLWGDIDGIQMSIREDVMVDNVFVSRTNLQSDGGVETATINITIFFKDATEIVDTTESVGGGN